ncbi:hypothetical protein EUBSIR_02339 [[Eubacterium] siraeum DSM 15702]|uniref:EamA domain-containing protein n=1 Tax=[Eubacterium] siraeum DSM 15702 TaxID=428128 RepID=B0MR72_9FIRM|nr:hypothetical protein EUBSIR_02339 [[Eubacterium] siraeum DSM 15702]UWP24523.1 hypothetical protein NQ549_08205 [[Eubacterium] siraeum]
MNVVILMLAVTACYTICSLNDKYAAAKANFSGDEFTFLMCSSMSVFLALSLPFQNLSFSLTWQSFLAVLLVAMCKMLEFQMSARVLKQLSAFELKAWLGITLFASYFTDILFGSELSVFKLICIFATAAGLVFIARSSKGGVNYKQIILPLVLYLVSKYGYGLIIRSFSPYASSTMQLLPAMVIISLIMLPRVHIRELIKNNRSGVVKVVLARIPNTLGMLLENAVISISLANYSFIQPMILVTLFVIGLIRREKRSRLNLIGSIICIVGIVAFQLA